MGHWPGPACTRLERLLTNIVAVASDGPLPTDGVKGLDLHDTAALADLVLANAKLR